VNITQTCSEPGADCSAPPPSCAGRRDVDDDVLDEETLRVLQEAALVEQGLIGAFYQFFLGFTIGLILGLLLLILSVGRVYTFPRSCRLGMFVGELITRAEELLLPP